MKLDKPYIDGQIYLTGTWLAWDLENTTHGNAQARDPRNEVICTAWRNSAGERGLFYGDLIEDAEFNKQLNAADFVIAHGGKHEASWLLRAGIDPKRFMWADTLLFEWVILGNNPDMLRLGLDQVSERYGWAQRKDPRVQSMFDAGINANLIPLDLLAARCRQDVDMTVHVFQAQIKRLQEMRAVAPAASRCLLMPVLATMEGVGITLGKEDVIVAHAEAERLAFQLTAEMREVQGGEFNENSANEMLPLVYGMYPASVKEEDRTVNSLGFQEPQDHKGNVKRSAPNKNWPEGRPALNKVILEQLEKQAKTPRQKRWVELRRALSKQRALLSKNLDFFLGAVTETHGKFYAQLMQGITATHRLSSLGLPVQFSMFDGEKSVQVQNVPRSLKYLQQSPDPDYLMFDVDGMQLEFRVAAFLGNDDAAKADILNPDFDAHLQTLTCMLNKGKFDQGFYMELLHKYRAGDKKVATDRADNVLCKSHTFKPLFGGMSGTKVQQSYYEFFNEKYAGIAKTQATWLNEVERGRPIVTPTGLQFQFRTSDRWGKCIDTIRDRPVKPSAYNYPIQSFAGGELIPISIVHLVHAVVACGLRVVFTNTVHDSVTGYVHKDDVKAFVALVGECFTERVAGHLKTAYNLTYDVPLGVEIKIGAKLGEGDKFVCSKKVQI